MGLMRALWIEDGAVSLRQVEVPEPGSDEVRVRVSLAGICDTDLQLLRGYAGFVGVPGHEFVGRVDLGPPEWLGRRVVAEINHGCGCCEMCRRGLGRHCSARQVLGIRGRWGAFAEALVVPTANLHAIPDDVPDRVAVFTEPLAAALAIQQQVSMGTTDRILVVGDGKLGSLVALAIADSGCSVTVVGRHASKLKALADAGLRVVVDGQQELSDFDVAIDCAGNPTGFKTARRALRPAGTLVIKSTYAEPVDVDLSSIAVDEISIIGSRCGPFPAAIDRLESLRVDPSFLLEREYPLSEGVAAFDHAARGGARKILLKP